MWYIKLEEATNAKTPSLLCLLNVLVAYFLLVLFCVYASTLQNGDQTCISEKKTYLFINYFVYLSFFLKY